MFVFPSNLRLRELRSLGRSRRGISDLGNQICGGSFRDTVHEHTDKRDFQDDGECEGETEQDTLSVQEPSTLLFGGEGDAAEIWLELQLVRYYSMDRGDLIGLQVHASNCGMRSMCEER